MPIFLFLNNRLKIVFIYILRGEGREKERERNINQLALARPHLETWPATQACALTGNCTGDLLVHRPVAFNPEAHQPGLCLLSTVEYSRGDVVGLRSFSFKRLGYLYFLPLETQEPCYKKPKPHGEAKLRTIKVNQAS